MKLCNLTLRLSSRGCTEKAVPFAAAETPSLKGQSFSGATGLYSIPTGRIGWEKTANFGLDFGYRGIFNDAGNAHIPSFTISLFKWVELSAAFDIQKEIMGVSKNGRLEPQDNDDLLLGVKVQLPTQNQAVAIGTNVQFINLFNDTFPRNARYNAIQPYLAVTFPGTFFKMPAETTIVFGKTFYTGDPYNNSNIDLGMGFDLLLFPDVFGNLVHLIIDFANFSYSDNAWPNRLVQGTGPAWYRGIFNTGFRIDMASIPALSKIKFVIDFVFVDLFDDGHRSISVGAVFGIPLGN